MKSLERKADTIFYHGVVQTVDASGTIASAAAVSDGRILAVGEDEEVLALAGADTQKIDLAGRSLVPGFIDSHLHTAVFGSNALAVDCRSPGVGSVEEIKEKIREAAKTAPKGAWIRGWGYDHSKLAEKRHPNRWDLDEAAPDNPVMIARCCAHISTHNSKSLALAGIGDFDDPGAGGGAYEKIDGKVSGVMFENAHMNMMKVAGLSKEELIEAMETASSLLVREGITSVHDSGGYGPVQMRAVQEAIEKGVLKLRMNMMIFSFVDNLDFNDDMMKIGSRSGLGDDRLRLGPLKIMIDGSSSGPTAATRQPYTSNPNDSGIMSMSPEQVEDFVMRGHRGGWQVTCHAVGDKAVDAMLTAFEKAQKAYPRENCRHRIEHCAMMTEGLLERVKALGIVPIPQPVFLYEFGDGYVVNYGPERAKRMFPCKTFLDAGVIAAASTDCPVTFSNPLLNIYMAVTRTTQTGQVIAPEECISVEEAIRMYTYNGAYASFEEGVKGSIEPGKLADLVVLSEDILKTPKNAIKDVVVDLTMIGGEVVFDRVHE
jgi:predicted amidohydrolase YtcJ